MPDYHIGTIDAESLALLSEEPDEGPAGDVPRPVFLQSRLWSKAILSTKKQLSADTKVFIFTLDHEGQSIGLPVGQHLMVRLRDPATREAIIRAYTPISEVTDRGVLQVLVKIYYDTAEKKGGRMTQALDSLPHWPLCRVQRAGRQI